MADNNMVNQQMMQNQQIQQNGVNQQTMLNQQNQQLPLYNYNQQVYGNPYYQTSAVNPYSGYQQWGNYQNQQQSPQQQPVQSSQQAQNPVEYILLDGSAPNKKRKYVFVGEVDMQTNAIQPLPSFTLEDVRKVVASEFDVRFGEEKKK